MRSVRNWQFRFPVYTFQTKKTALDYLYPFLSFSVHNFCARTDGWSTGRTDIFRKSFLFSCWSRIYIHVYTYLDYFPNFTPILTRVSIPFLLWKWVWKNRVWIALQWKKLLSDTLKCIRIPIHFCKRFGKMQYRLWK